jgi:hypothetical protein
LTAQPQVADAARKLSRSLANLADSTAGYVGERIDQIDSACRAERRRWVWMALSAAAALCWLVIATVFAALAIVAAYSGSSPVVAIAAVAGGFVLLSAGAGYLFWQLGRRRATLAGRVGRLATLFLEHRRFFR